MKRLAFILAATLISGCIFGNDDPKSLGSPDAADDTSSDDSGATNVVTNDLGSRDLGNRDLGRPDMTSPRDIGPDQNVADMGVDMPAPDMGMDMSVGPPPWIVVAQHTLALGGTPTLTDPPEVSSMANGFLVGYVDSLSDTATFGWYTSDSANVLATDDFPATELPIDVASTSEGGFAVFESTHTVYGVWFQPVVAAVPTMTSTLFQATFQATNREFKAAVEADTTYTISSVTSVNGQPTVDIGLIDMGGLGFASTASRTSYDLRNLEIMGGDRGAGRRVLGAGAIVGGYRLLDYQFDINVAPDWQVDEFRCGTATSDPRIIPLKDHWALLKHPAVGGTVLTVAECVDLSSTVATQLDVVVPTSGQVVDFDVAKEDLHIGADFGIAWVEGTTPMFGRLFFDPGAGTVALQDPMVIPNAGGRKIRAAFNETRQQWGVVVTNATSAELIILQRNPNFP